MEIIIIVIITTCSPPRHVIYPSTVLIPSHVSAARYKRTAMSRDIALEYILYVPGNLQPQQTASPRGEYRILIYIYLLDNDIVDDNFHTCVLHRERLYRTNTIVAHVRINNAVRGDKRNNNFRFYVRSFYFPKETMTDFIVLIRDGRFVNIIFRNIFAYKTF